MTTSHDLATNIRLLSVQAGVAGGALTAALGTFQAAMTVAHLQVTVPPVLYIVAGVLTAVGVFLARMVPQPNVMPQKEG